MPAYGKNLSPPEIEALVSFSKHCIRPTSRLPTMLHNGGFSQRRRTAPSRRPMMRDRHARRSLHPVGLPWAVTVALALTALIYTRGWLRIRRTRPAQFPAWRLYCFLSGIAALFVAVASPLDTFSGSLLFMHMAQHFVLMSIAPPLFGPGSAGCARCCAVFRTGSFACRCGRSSQAACCLRLKHFSRAPSSRGC